MARTAKPKECPSCKTRFWGVEPLVPKDLAPVVEKHYEESLKAMRETPSPLGEAIRKPRKAKEVALTTSERLKQFREENQ